MAAKKRMLATDSARFTLRLPLGCELDSELADYLYSHEKGSYRSEAIRGIARAGYSLLMKHKSEEESFMDMQTLGYEGVFNKGKPSENKAFNELKSTNELLTQQLKSKDEQLQQMQMQLANIQNSFNSLLAMLSAGGMGMPQMQQMPQMQPTQQMPQMQPMQPVQPVQSAPMMQQEQQSLEQGNLHNQSIQQGAETDLEEAKEPHSKMEVPSDLRKEPSNKNEDNPVREDTYSKSGKPDLIPKSDPVESKPSRPIFSDLEDEEEALFDEDIIDDKVSGILDDIENEYEESFSIDDDLIDPLDGFLDL